MGERYIYTDVEKYNPSGITLKIVGIWEPINPDDQYWVYDPYLFTNTMFVTEDSLFNRVLPVMPKALHEVSWYGIFDYTKIHSTNAGRVLSGLQFLETRAQLIFPSARLHPTLSQILDEFQRRAFLLNILLFALTVPMIAVVLYYIATSFGMVIERQRGEIALLKSRGGSTGQIILHISARRAHPRRHRLLTRAAHRRGDRPDNRLGLQLPAIRQASAARADDQRPDAPVRRRRRRARARGEPGPGDRGGTALDHQLQAGGRAVEPACPSGSDSSSTSSCSRVAAYGYNMLRQRQSIIQLGTDESLVIDPLLLIVPSVFIFACALLFLRLFPLITAILGRTNRLCSATRRSRSR